MIETIVITLLVTKLRKNNIKAVFKDFAFYPLFFFTLIYVYLEYLTFQGDYSLTTYNSIYKILYLSSLIILIMKFRLLYSSLFGTLCIIIGTWLNQIVVNANNGRMPVFPSFSVITGYYKPGMFEKIHNDIHVLGNRDTKFKWLSDIFDTGYSIMSLGDLIIRLCVFVIFYSAINELNKREIKV